MTLRPRRSALYLPASNARAIDKARTLDCDVVILDLEDAVAPEMKASARDAAVAAVREGGFGSRELVVRINGLDTPWGADDLAALAEVSPDAILAPKVNGPDDVAPYVARMGDAQTSLWVMIETAISLFRLEPIAATASAGRLSGFVLGTNDLAKEIGCELDVLRQPLIGALGLTVAAARAHGLVVLDGVYNDIDDDEGFVAQTKQALAFGFDGKTLIHPRQIAPCNAVFTPDADAVAWAERIVAAFDAPENADKGAIRVDGKMVERLHLHRAHRVLAAIRTA